MTHLISRKRMGFAAAPLHRSREPHAFHFLSQRTSFWLATMALLAFVAGNMIGQHGWQVFWKSVMGRDDDSLIVYNGTVTPVALVPDYVAWGKMGGNPQEHTFREVPKDLLIPLPEYSSNLSDPARSLYSVSYMGSYTSGKENSGSHPAVDIRVPVGTPVRSVAAGIVTEVKQATGFGLTVVIRHPNVPDPSNPGKVAELYSSYAHLSSAFVTEGSVVEKGGQIALSGVSGDATGPHLHFQIDRSDAPWHPYWPFTAEELNTMGYTPRDAVNRGFMSTRAIAFTVNPLLYVQADPRPATTVAAASSSSSSGRAAPDLSWAERVKARIAVRISDRVMERLARRVALHGAAASSGERSPEKIPSSSTGEPEVPVERTVVVSRTEIEPASVSATNVVSLDFSHDGSFTERQWERIRLTLLDAEGNPVKEPALERDIALRTAYGEAEFQPQTLTVFDFHDGRAEVSMLPHGRRGIVIEAMPFKALSQPMKYEK